MSINFAVMFRLKFRFSKPYRPSRLRCCADCRYIYLCQHHQRASPRGHLALWLVGGSACGPFLSATLPSSSESHRCATWLSFSYVYLRGRGGDPAQWHSNDLLSFLPVMGIHALDNGWPTRPDDDYGAHPRQAHRKGPMQIPLLGIDSDRGLPMEHILALLHFHLCLRPLLRLVGCRWGYAEEPLCWGLHVWP